MDKLWRLENGAAWWEDEQPSEEIKLPVENKLAELNYTVDMVLYKVDINKPFSGSIVPLKYYRIDKRVNSIMIEINKRIYRQAGESDSNKVMELSNMFSSILPMLEKTV